MVSIQLIAFFLLVARVISIAFIVIVLRLQWRLFKTEIDFSLVPNMTKLQKRNVYRVRKVLFILSCIILLGNFIPILIDTITIFDNNLGRPANLRPISVAYAASNAFTAMFSAIMIWALYKLAGLSTSDSK